MHTDELWQVFLENGQAVSGRGAIDDAFDEDPTLVMGNSHVWFWRKTDAGVEILLQKRAITKKRSPGMYHISAAGHINVDEAPLVAAVRETREEVGLTVDPTKLYLVHTTRSRSLQSFVYVYTYQLAGDETFSFDDGEVELVKWFNIEDFREMTKDPASHNMIDQGRAYFDPLIDTLVRLAA